MGGPWTIVDIGPLPDGWTDTRPTNFITIEHPLIKEQNPTLRSIIFDKLPSNNIVYHYCSNAAFKGIVENSEVWSTDALMTNDFYELKWLMNIVAYVIENKFSNDANIIEHIYRYLEVNVANSSAFISCFSKEKDVLSQWRAYADDGRGVSIGIDLSTLNIPLCFSYWGSPVNSSGFCPVIYDIKFLLLLVEEIIKSIKSKNFDFNASYRELNTLHVLAYAVKKEAFREEDEWRFVLPFTPSNFLGYGTHSFEFGYRNSDSSVSKYAKLKINSESIKNIVLGPKNLSLGYHVRDFLVKNGFRNFLIQKSEASYR